MAGHNKWSKIKHKKAVTDAKRSKEFSKLARFIAVESKKSGGDTNAPGLRMAIDKARRVNMPSDNIDRAVARGSSADAEELEAVVYETYGPGGIAVIATGLTDNRNRTAAELKHLLSKLGYQLAQPGSAAWAFTLEGGEYTPTTVVDVSEEDGDKLGTLIDALEDHDDVQDVYTNAA